MASIEIVVPTSTQTSGPLMIGAHRGEVLVSIIVGDVIDSGMLGALCRQMFANEPKHTAASGGASRGASGGASTTTDASTEASMLASSGGFPDSQIWLRQVKPSGHVSPRPQAVWS
ncbi:MAG TPA: hypothetical protein VFD36_04810 [Kofleriaceae bacterium]|nr:hypothetical protein [Kofleriaceae bacterium]